jgi:hypothetical protein
LIKQRPVGAVEAIEDHALADGSPAMRSEALPKLVTTLAPAFAIRERRQLIVAIAAMQTK